jgi:hypothetical protein
MRRSTRAAVRAFATTAVAATAVLATAVSANAYVHYPHDGPDLRPYLTGFGDFWTLTDHDTMAGVVNDPAVLQHNDEMIVWINNHATPEQQRNALQTSEYSDGPTADPDLLPPGMTYDESITDATALGSVLAPIYIGGRGWRDDTAPFDLHTKLPLVDALINSENGTAGDYVGTEDVKDEYNYSRPFMPVTAMTGECTGRVPAVATSSASLVADRMGKPWANPDGSLHIEHVADWVDTTHEFSPHDVPLSPSYQDLCDSGSFPSGHTTTAYQAGLVLATLLPELAPEILARASEQGNNRIVLGVHYPLDIIGGRISGHVAIAAYWSNPQFRTDILEPARKELVDYLQAECGGTILECYQRGTPYQSNPYGGQVVPGGTDQIVTDRASAVSVFTERLTYGFPASGTTGLPASVPAGAENLLLTTYPTLNDAQRASILAQTEIPSGYPLDLSNTSVGGWQRLNLAAAMSATVVQKADGSVKVISTGGTARVLSGTATETAGPRTIAPGESGTFSFAGFLAGETVDLTLRGESASRATMALGMLRTAVDDQRLTATASASGTVTVTVTLPASARGAYTLTATGVTSGITGTAAFSVGLPATGVDGAETAGLWIGGGILLLGGVGVMIFAARRRGSRAPQ